MYYYYYYITCFPVTMYLDSLYGLVVRISGYRSRGPGSIPDATRFSEKYCVRNGVHSASRVQFRSYLKEIVAALV
jgi:hypothetical protein